MTALAFPPWEPDKSDFQSGSTATVLNAVPRKDGWGPFPSIVALSQALAAVSRGYFYARKNDGSIVVFAATSTKLYMMSNTDFSWGDVSKGSSTYSAIPSADQWQFAQFGNIVIACQINTVPQAFDLTSSTNFADLGGSPPQARYITIVNRFVVLSGLGSTTPYRIQWSGLNAITTWTSGVSSSDFQDLPDGGIVRTVAGGETGLITQDAALRRMIYAPGSSYVFQIERISEEKGIFAPLSLTRAGDRVFFAGVDGFKMVLPGGYPQPIGRERVDRTFLADIDQSNLQLCLGASDPKSGRWFLAYKSLSGATGNFDKIICYDWTLDRWFLISASGEFLSTLARPGVTLESLDSISGSIDALTTSLDDFSIAAQAQLSIFDTNHKLGFFTGANLEATLVSDEESGDGQRIFVRGFRPITDAPTVYGAISARETLQATASYDTETLINAIGFIPKRVSTRYARAKIRIPAGTVWTYAQSLESDAGPDGMR